MRRWWLIIALLLSLGLNLGIAAALIARRAADRPRAQRPEMNVAAGNPLPRLPRLADRLGLEGEERRRFLDLQWKLFEESSRFRLRLGEVHREIKREMVREEPDRQRVESLLQESARVYLSLERSLTRNILATRELLDEREEKEYLRMIGRIGIPISPGAGQVVAPEPRKGDQPRAEDRFQQRERRLQQWEERLRQREERMREIQERLQERRNLQEDRPRRRQQPRERRQQF